MGVPPHLRRRDLRCSSCSTSSTSTSSAPTPSSTTTLLGVYATPGRPRHGVAARRGAAVPRAQRPADRRSWTSGRHDPLPPRAVVRELGRVRASSGIPVAYRRSWRRASGRAADRAPGEHAARRSAQPDARSPAGSGCELAVWYLMRLTGLGLFVLALSHYLILHFLYDPAEQNAGWIADERWSEHRSGGRLRLADADVRAVPRLHGHADRRRRLHAAAASRVVADDAACTCWRDRAVRHGHDRRR